MALMVGSIYSQLTRLAGGLGLLLALGTRGNACPWPVAPVHSPPRHATNIPTEPGSQKPKAPPPTLPATLPDATPARGYERAALSSSYSPATVPPRVLRSAPVGPAPANADGFAVTPPRPRERMFGTLVSQTRLVSAVWMIGSISELGPPQPALQS
ncbi:MAG: hypothetical protein U1D55_09260 [Phycisphaerae bacterium]